MSNPVIVVHYHEVWLKGRNRRFFLRKLHTSLRLALQGLPVNRIEPLGDRMLVWIDDSSALPEISARIDRVLGIAFYAIAQPAERTLEALCEKAWNQVEDLRFSNFVVRVKRSDKSFPLSSVETESAVGKYILDRSARAESRSPCSAERSGADLLHRDHAGELPWCTRGRSWCRRSARRSPPGAWTCLLSGGFDSAVAAYQMMKRGAHTTFVHFYGAGAEPGESSAWMWRASWSSTWSRYQTHAKLYRVPFEPIQRELASGAPEEFRVLLYRRMMLRIAESFRSTRSFVWRWSLATVSARSHRKLCITWLPWTPPRRWSFFRPLVGTDKEDIIVTMPENIGTYPDFSAEPFHDCCPMFLSAPARAVRFTGGSGKGRRKT